MNPFVVRPVAEKDFTALKRLASSVKGLTTLPDDDELLQGKIYDSMRALSHPVRKPGGESYLFVLENRENGEIGGVSGIVSKVGGFDPYYTYQLRKERLHSLTLKVDKEIRVLTLHVNHNGPTEICSLFVAPPFRRSGVGRLLSLSRFLFMAEYPRRFDKSVISELRGVVNPDGVCPFWDCVGRHFFDTDFYRADFLTGVGQKDVIAELMPKHPIYIDLLPDAAKKVIGQVHEDTKGALSLLKSEGFTVLDEVDIFDAGPTVSCPLPDIRTVKRSRKAKVADVAVSGFEHRQFLIANTKLEFRCVMGTLAEDADGNVVLPETVVQALAINPGDEVRTVAVKGTL